jgi:hypothetical protein
VIPVERYYLIEKATNVRKRPERFNHDIDARHRRTLMELGIRPLAR